MPFTNPIVGGSGTLIRQAIQSPDYVAGVSGWSIKRDGTADFNNVTVRGSLATGAAGGPQAYLTINDAVDRTTIDFWNAAGTNNAYINSPQSGGGVPQIGANTGLYNIGGGTQGRSRLFLTAGGVQLERVRESDQGPEGGQLLLSDTDARMQQRVAGTSAATGGRVIAGASAWLEYESAGTSVHGVRTSSDGVHSFGTYVSDASWSAVASAGWTLTSFTLNAWGPFVDVNVVVTKSGAAIGPGAVNSTAVTVTSSWLPPATAGLVIVSSANGGSGSLNSAGALVVNYVNAVVNVGNALRINGTFWAPQ